MSAQPVEPEVELPELASIRTFMLGSFTHDLCLATRHDPGDPQPHICARESHLPEDDRHLTYKYGSGWPGCEQYTWREGP
jgi:hypothetical protein